MCRRHQANLLTYFEHRLTNGPIEGLNNRIQGFGQENVWLPQPRTLQSGYPVSLRRPRPLSRPITIHPEITEETKSEATPEIRKTETRAVSTRVGGLRDTARPLAPCHQRESAWIGGHAGGPQGGGEDPPMTRIMQTTMSPSEQVHLGRAQVHLPGEGEQRLRSAPSPHHVQMTSPSP
jgi:hypothetical protein